MAPAVHPEVHDRRVRSIAFYLPQYHPIPENDRWWGEGFTEWTNVTKARSRFRGHQQPHLPADLGFYDLRLPEARQAQADLAAGHRIDAFAYYHYWFGGRRLLERPFHEVLASGEPDQPFLLCWANEPWSRRWDGSEQDVLVDQAHSAADHEAHARWLLDAFADERYVRVDGRPVFMVYRAALIPDIVEATDTYRRVATEAGLPEPYLLRVESFASERGDPRDLGFDAAVQFQPDHTLSAWAIVDQTCRALRVGPDRRASLFRMAALPDAFEAGAGGDAPLRYVAEQLLQAAGRRLPLSVQPARSRDVVQRYERLVEANLHREPASYPLYPCVAPGWDNSARKAAQAFILTGATPERYGRWVEATLAASAWRGDHDLLFVNAWNEWAEGCHLEPDRRWGRAFLEAHKAAIEASEAPVRTSAV